MTIPDILTEIHDSEIYELSRNDTVELRFHPDGTIVLQCGNKIINNIREFMVSATTHSGSNIKIRVCEEKDSGFFEWRDYLIVGENSIYVAFKRVIDAK